MRLARCPKCAACRSFGAAELRPFADRRSRIRSDVVCAEGHEFLSLFGQKTQVRHRARSRFIVHASIEPVQGARRSPHRSRRSPEGDPPHPPQGSAPEGHVFGFSFARWKVVWVQSERASDVASEANRRTVPSRLDPIGNGLFAVSHHWLSVSFRWRLMWSGVPGTRPI
jgi:hypothetical protein